MPTFYEQLQGPRYFEALSGRGREPESPRSEYMDEFQTALDRYLSALGEADAQAAARRAKPRAFGDTEADIQREVIDPFQKYGSLLLAPFARGSSATRSNAPRTPTPPRVHGTAAGGYFTIDPVTGEATEIRPAVPPTERVQRLPISPGEIPGLSQPETINIRPSQLTPEFLSALPEYARTNEVSRAIQAMRPNAPAAISPPTPSRQPKVVFGTPEEEAASYLQNFNTIADQLSSSLNPTSEQRQEVRRKTKSGRTAIFDSATKEFLRFSE